MGGWAESSACAGVRPEDEAGAQEAAESPRARGAGRLGSGRVSNTTLQPRDPAP